ILQGDVDKSVRVFGRLIINTTVGLGGLFDVAKYYEIDSVNEDFSQALGYHGVPTGPYLVLPILGPSSGRGAVGQVVDMFLNPLVFISPSFLVGSGITIGRNVNDTSFTMDGYNDLKESAVDPYVSMRDFTHQYREGLIRE
ncbi:MAG: MlaA family lipoprotein, partial [Nitrospinales bacterium]